MSKGFAPILIVLIITALVGGYLLYQKQTKPVVVPQPVVQTSPSPVTSETSNSAETANWKTYTTKYYLIQYPANWKLTKANGNATFTSITNGMNLMISAIDTSKGIGDIGGAGQPSRAKDVTIGGVNAKKLFFDQELTKTENRMTVSFKKGNIYYSISANNKTKDFSTIDQILSTFKFLQ